MRDTHICFCLLVHTAVRLAVRSIVQYCSPVVYNFCIFYFATPFNCIYIVWCFCDISQVLRNTLIDFIHQTWFGSTQFNWELPCTGYDLKLYLFFRCLCTLIILHCYENCFMAHLQWKVAKICQLALPIASLLLPTYMKLRTAKWILIRFRIREFYKNVSTYSMFGQNQVTTTDILHKQLCSFLYVSKA